MRCVRGFLGVKELGHLGTSVNIGFWDGMLPDMVNIEKVNEHGHLVS
jgi:hypothetical protein